MGEVPFCYADHLPTTSHCNCNGYVKTVRNQLIKQLIQLNNKRPTVHIRCQKLNRGWR